MIQARKSRMSIFLQPVKEESVEDEILILDKPLPPGIDAETISKIVFVQFFANLFINVDMGILPAGSLIIKEELELDNS